MFHSGWSALEPQQKLSVLLAPFSCALGDSLRFWPALLLLCFLPLLSTFMATKKQKYYVDFVEFISYSWLAI